MTPREEWRGHYERTRVEAAQFAARAIARRKDAQECRRRRDWIGAMLADERAREYRGARDQLTSEARKIKAQWGFR